ncbi:MAG: MATE family efflux transporter [Candidatus Izemoplasmatales bacterium]|nr:MATE family efflux transporter [Candidatus Izemoplasmatales bacterium]
MQPYALSQRESERRNKILGGNLWKVIPLLTLPLAVYALFNYLYGFFDLIVVSFIGKNEVASIVFIDEIKNAIAAFGVGIAAGGTVLVARSYGAGNFDDARRNASASFAIAILVAVIVVLVVLAFGEGILRLLNAPPEIIEVGLGYFNIQIITTAIMAINSVFIGLEKAKGNTSLILWLNIVAMIVKLALTATFVFGLGKGTEYVALATLIAQSSLMVVGLIILFNKNNSLRLSLKLMIPKKTWFLPILSLSIPVFAGKFLFSMGKVLVNSMAAFYGPLAVAAFGITMKISSSVGTLGQVFEDSEIGIIGQNLGNRNLKRARDTYLISQLYSLSISILGIILVSSFFDRIVPLFTDTNDTLYQAMLTDIFRLERFSMITSSTIAVITGMFIGFKRTNVAFFLNIIRLFIFRLPSLLIMINADIGYVALGYTMLISNTMTAIVAVVFLIIFLKRLKLYGYMDLRYLG